MAGGAPGRPRMLRARWLPMMDGMLCIACLSYVRLNNSGVPQGGFETAYGGVCPANGKPEGPLCKRTHPLPRVQ